MRAYITQSLPCSSNSRGMKQQRFSREAMAGGVSGELRLPFLRVRPQKLPLVDGKGRLNVETRGLPKTFLYWGDLFHTLVNMPNLRFIGILVVTYFLLYGGFAVPYYYDAYNNNCIPGVLTFDHALWFSVQTSMTIGYGGDLTPDPSCTITNIMVLVQSLASLLVAYSLLGVFYVRFSRPARRAQTVIFSRYITMHDEDGGPVIAMRIANIRKHQIIEANVRMLIGFNNTVPVGGREDDDETVFHFTSLPVIGGNQVFLGLPCSVKHPITPTSPLYGLSIQELEDADMEILVLLEGVDASTSCKLQARHSYLPRDMRKDVHHETMVFRSPNGRRCVDFTKFDSLLPVSSGALITRPDSSANLPPISHSARYAFLDSRNVNDGDEARLSVLGSRNSLPEDAPNWFSRQSLPKSLGRGDSWLSGTEDASEEQAEVEQVIAQAEAQAEEWKLQLLELATLVHETLQRSSSAANDADQGPLIACATKALSLASSD